MRKIKVSTQRKKKQLRLVTLPQKWIEVFKNNSKVQTSRNAYNWHVVGKNDVTNAQYSGRGYDSQSIAMKMAKRHAAALKDKLKVFNIK